MQSGLTFAGLYLGHTKLISYLGQVIIYKNNWLFYYAIILMAEWKTIT